MKLNRIRLLLYSQQTPRLFSSSTASRTAFSHGPAPPRLPKAEQDLYEELQRSSNGAFSTPKGTPTNATLKSSPYSPQKPILQINQSPQNDSDPTSTREDKVTVVHVKGQVSASASASALASGYGEELHPDIRKGVQPEFEGERNPKTGEVGGPKNEPLRWGGGADWSYNGRVTDF